MSLEADNEGFAAGKEKSRFVNQRRTVRYIRKDIDAGVCIGSWLDAVGLNWFRKTMAVELLDISNRGCLIGCPQKLAVGAKVQVVLQFKTGKRFNINGAVVRKSADRGREYGIKFAAYNDELGDYMLTTQKELTFK